MIVTVANHGPQDATEVSVSGEIPFFFQIIDISPACEIEDGLLSCIVGEIEAGESKEAWISLVFTQTGIYHVFFEAAGLELDPNLENNLVSADFLVEKYALYLPLIQKP
jgi:hypothetical protein